MVVSPRRIDGYLPVAIPNLTAVEFLIALRKERFGRLDCLFVGYVIEGLDGHDAIVSYEIATRAPRDRTRKFLKRQCVKLPRPILKWP
jgi:hypothetical protein